MDIKQQLISPNRKKRPQKHLKPTTLTIHSTGNPSSTARNEANWLENPSNTRAASFHYVVDDKECIQTIPNNEVAYHSGNSNGNNSSLSLEICESGNREKTIKNAVEVTVQILKKYGWNVSHLRQHKDWSGKDCPRILLHPESLWNNFVNEVEKRLNNSTPNKSNYTVNYCLEWQKFYNTSTKTKAPLTMDGKYGMKTENSLMSLLYYIKQGRQYKYCLEFQKWYNKTTQTSARLSEDGLWGKNTERAFDTIHTIIKVFK